jgi:hypothetical protein
MCTIPRHLVKRKTKKIINNKFIRGGKLTFRYNFTVLDVIKYYIRWQVRAQGGPRGLGTGHHGFREIRSIRSDIPAGQLYFRAIRRGQ